MVERSRTDRRKQRTAQAILDVAQAVFDQVGFDLAKIEQIAEAADVAPGSVYNHFGTKEGLYLAVAERALEADERYMDEAYDESLPPGELLAAVGLWYMRFCQDHPELFRLLAFPDRRIEGSAAEAVAERIAERVDVQNARFVAALKAGIAVGEIRAVPPEETTTFLWAAWSGVLALRWRPDSLRRSDEDLRRLLDIGIDLFMNGLRPAATANS